MTGGRGRSPGNTWAAALPLSPSLSLLSALANLFPSVVLFFSSAEFAWQNDEGKGGEGGKEAPDRTEWTDGRTDGRTSARTSARTRKQIRERRTRRTHRTYVAEGRKGGRERGRAAGVLVILRLTPSSAAPSLLLFQARIDVGCSDYMAINVGTSVSLFCARGARTHTHSRAHTYTCREGKGREGVRACRSYHSTLPPFFRDS